MFLIHCSMGTGLFQVINMDLPNDDVTYVHRIGRTGRLNNGIATSFFDEYRSSDVNIARKLVEVIVFNVQHVDGFLIYNFLYKQLMASRAG